MRSKDTWRGQEVLRAIRSRRLYNIYCRWFGMVVYRKLETDWRQRLSDCSSWRVRSVLDSTRLLDVVDSQLSRSRESVIGLTKTGTLYASTPGTTPPILAGVQRPCNTLPGKLHAITARPRYTTADSCIHSGKSAKFSSFRHRRRQKRDRFDSAYHSAGNDQGHRRPSFTHHGLVHLHFTLWRSSSISIVYLLLSFPLLLD